MQYVLDLELTNICYYKCEICVNKFLKDKGFMNPAVLDKILRLFLYDPNLNYINIWGIWDIESLPNKLYIFYWDIIEKYSSFLDDKILFNLKIGKTKYDLENSFIKFLYKFYKSNFLKWISIWIFDYFILSSSNDSWNISNFLYNLNLLYKLFKDKVNIEIVITKYIDENVNKIKKFIDLIKSKYSYVDIFFQRVHNRGWFFSGIELESGKTKHIYKIFENFNKKNNIHCYKNFAIYINYKGNIYVCSLLGYKDEYYIGNIEKFRSLKDIVVSLKKFNIPFVCWKCNVKDRCFIYEYLTTNDR